MRSFITKYKTYVVVAGILVLGVAVWMGSCGVGSGVFTPTPEPGDSILGDSTLEAPATYEDAIADAASESDAVEDLEPSGEELPPGAADGTKVGANMDGEPVEEDLSETESSGTIKAAAATSVKYWFDSSDASYWYCPVDSNGWKQFTRSNPAGQGFFRLSPTLYSTPTHGFVINPYGDGENDYISAYAFSVPPSAGKSILLSLVEKHDLETGANGEAYDYVRLQVDAGDGLGYKTLKTFYSKNKYLPQWSKWSFRIPSNTGSTNRKYRIRFVMVSDASIQNWGFAVDELRVFWDKATDSVTGPIAVTAAAGLGTEPEASDMVGGEVEINKNTPAVVGLVFREPGGVGVKNSGVRGAEVRFDVSDCYDPDNKDAPNKGISMYWFDIGADGTWEEHMTSPPTKTYSFDHTTLVRIKVADMDGVETMGPVVRFTCTDDPNQPPDGWMGEKLPPFARFTASPTTGPSPLTVTLDASASWDPDGGAITQYDWDIDNDGTRDVFGPEKVRQITIDRDGGRLIRLVVHDDEGVEAATDPVGVNAHAGYPREGSATSQHSYLLSVPPTAAFTSRKGGRGNSAYLDASASFTPGFGGIKKYEWQFENSGTWESDDDPGYEKQFSKSGSYVVRLRVTDGRGLQAEVQRDVAVSFTLPTARFTYKPAAAPLTMLVDASTSQPGDPDSRLVLYWWDVEGDGTWDIRDNDPFTEIQYGKTGGFKATLKVGDDQGNESFITQTIPVVGKETPPPPPYGGPVTLPPLGTYKVNGNKVKIRIWSIKCIHDTSEVGIDEHDDLYMTCGGYVTPYLAQAIWPQARKAVNDFVTVATMPMKTGEYQEDTNYVLFEEPLLLQNEIQLPFHFIEDDTNDFNGNWVAAFAIAGSALGVGAETQQAAEYAREIYNRMNSDEYFGAVQFRLRRNKDGTISVGAMANNSQYFGRSETGGNGGATLFATEPNPVNPRTGQRIPNTIAFAFHHKDADASYDVVYHVTGSDAIQELVDKAWSMTKDEIKSQMPSWVPFDSLWNTK